MVYLHGSSLSEDREQQREHHNTSRRKGQELPARLPDTMNASPECQHDDQEKERDYSCHRSSSTIGRDVAGGSLADLLQ